MKKPGLSCTTRDWIAEASNGQEKHRKHDLLPDRSFAGLWKAWTLISRKPLSLEQSENNFDIVQNGGLRGNFYKCGDLTATPHWGSWNPVGTGAPDFHRPEYFGKMPLEG